MFEVTRNEGSAHFGQWLDPVRGKWALCPPAQ